MLYLLYLIFAVVTLGVFELFLKQRKNGKKVIILGIITGVFVLVFLIWAVSCADGIVMLILTLFAGFLLFLFNNSDYVIRSQKNQ